MEIINLDDAKKQLDNYVKCYLVDDIPDNLKSLPGIEGVLEKITSRNEHTRNGDNVISLSFDVTVIDPKDGGKHYIKPRRIFTLEAKENDIKNIEINDRITELQKQISDLELTKK